MQKTNLRRIAIPNSFLKPVSAQESWPKKMFDQHKPGSGHRMFGVPHGVKLPRTFLQKIVDTPLMETAINPTKIGHPSIKVTRLVKARANGLLNAIRLKKR